MAPWRTPSWWSTTDHLNEASARPMLRGTARRAAAGGRGRSTCTCRRGRSARHGRVGGASVSRDAVCAAHARVGRRLASVLDRCMFWRMSVRCSYFRVTLLRVVHRGRADTRELRGAVGVGGRSRDRKTEGCII
eukprot:3579034-Prymnesium_polylepis.1